MIHLLKLVGKWAFLKPAEELEGGGGGVEAAQDSVLPIYPGNNVLHTGSLHDTVKWTTHNLVSSSSYLKIIFFLPPSQSNRNQFSIFMFIQLIEHRDVYIPDKICILHSVIFRNVKTVISFHRE